MENGSEICHKWMMDLYTKKNVTLEEVNDRLIVRFLGGICFLSILMVVGLIGNAHVLFIYHRKFRRTNYRIYVLWLAMLDMFNCGISAPFVIFYLLHPANFPSSELCKIFRFILYFCGVASTASLVPIAIDRGRKILAPLKSQITSTQAKVMCLLSLIVALSLSWPAPILFGINSEPTGIPGLRGRRCLTEDRFVKSREIIIFNLAHLVYFLVVTALLLIVYSLIARIIWIHGTFRNTFQHSSVNSDIFDSNYSIPRFTSLHRSTLTLLVVTLVYILSALAYHALALVYFLIPGFDCSLSLPGAILYYTFIWSYFINSACNPFIYGFRDNTFRMEMKRLYKGS